MSTDREPEQAAKHDGFSAVLEGQRQEAQRLRRRAEDSIAAARVELDEIETSLARAFGGEEYVDVGEVKGVDAQAVFSALGTLRRSAEMELAAAEKVAVGAQRRLATASALRADSDNGDLQDDVRWAERGEQAAIRNVMRLRGHPGSEHVVVKGEVGAQAQRAVDPDRQALDERVEELREADRAEQAQLARAEDHAIRAKQRLTEAEVGLREDPDDSLLRAGRDSAGLEAWAASQALERFRPSSEPDLPVSEQPPAYRHPRAVPVFTRKERALMRAEIARGRRASRDQLEGVEIGNEHEGDAPDRDGPPAGRGAEAGHWPALAPDPRWLTSIDATEIKELRDHDPGERTRIMEAAYRDALRMRERVHERPPADLDPPAPEL